jgi:hypothetical protein
VCGCLFFLGGEGVCECGKGDDDGNDEGG